MNSLYRLSERQETAVNVLTGSLSTRVFETRTVTGREYFVKIMPHFFRETKTIAKTYLRAVSVKYLKLYSSDGEKNE